MFKEAKIMASSPITSWKIEGGNVGIVADFILGGSKITPWTKTPDMKFKDACSLEGN